MQIKLIIAISYEGMFVLQLRLVMFCLVLFSNLPALLIIFAPGLANGKLHGLLSIEDCNLVQD